MDTLIRYRIALVGYGKHVADKVIAFLDATTPAIRLALLDIFGTTMVTGSRLISRLREAEARLSRIRSRGWSRAADEAIRILLEIAHYTPKVLRQSVGKVLEVPTDRTLTARTKGALIAGRKVTEWLEAMKTSDVGRMIGQLRVAVIAGETVDQILGRLVGKLSPVAAATKRGLASFAESALGAVSAAVFAVAVAANKAVFRRDLWLSIIDNRTTEGCRRLHQQIFPSDSGPRPGYHFYCRSVRVPIDDTGEPYSPSTYESWASDQDDGFLAYAGKSLDVASLRPLTFQQVQDFV